MIMDLARSLIAELGVDPHDEAAVADLAAVGMTLMAWRNSPVEDWHAVPLSRISDAELMRASVATTRLIRGVIAEHRPPQRWSFAAPGQKAWGDGVGLFAAIGLSVGDRDRRLPDGRTVAGLAPSEGEAARYTAHVRHACRRWSLLAAGHGGGAVLMMLACVAGWLAHHWWLTPWWPARAAGFLDRLEQAPPPAPSAALLDPDTVRGRLVAAPDQLSTETIRCCLRLGLGDPDLMSRPRVHRHRYRDVALLLEPEVPIATRRAALLRLATAGSYP